MGADEQDSELPELRRRGQDTVVDMLRSNIHDLHDGLQNHITHCAKQQQRVLWAVIGTAGWMVVHSPEVLSVVGKLSRLAVP